MKLALDVTSVELLFSWGNSVSSLNYAIHQWRWIMMVFEAILWPHVSTCNLVWNFQSHLSRAELVLLFGAKHPLSGRREARGDDEQDT